jgi:hypothetical protein
LTHNLGVSSLGFTGPLLSNPPVEGQYIMAGVVLHSKSAHLMVLGWGGKKKEEERAWFLSRLCP